MRFDWFWSKTHENTLVVMAKSEDEDDSKLLVALLVILTKFFVKESLQ